MAGEYGRLLFEEHRFREEERARSSTKRGEVSLAIFNQYAGYLKNAEGISNETFIITNCKYIGVLRVQAQKIRNYISRDRRSLPR